MTTDILNFPTTKSAVLAFVTAVLTTLSQTFTGEELRHYAANRVTGGTTPNSVDRALRQLRQENRLDYVVLNRGKGLYRAVPLASFTSPVFNSLNNTLQG
jgi:hypothetical protein